MRSYHQRGHQPASCSNVDELAKCIGESLLCPGRVISFDIFDTLVERIIEPPDQVKRLAARILSEKTASLQVDTILRLRDEAEAILRAQSASTGLDHECRFSELAVSMAQTIANDPAEAEGIRTAIIAAELAAESRVLRVKKGMMEILMELKASGQRVIAISDMYLDSTLLIQLLKQLDLADCLDAIYVSADHGMGKYSGRLFRHVFATESIAPSSLLHIGDNAHSDYTMPLSQGSSAIHFRDDTAVLRQQIGQAYKWLSDRNPYWRGQHVVSGIPLPPEKDFFFDYGFGTLGPIYATFIASLRETLLADKIHHAFFLARDGELFHHLYALFDDPSLALPPAPTSSYLHISRKAVALPAAHRGLGRKQIELLLPRMQQRGFAAIAGALGFDPHLLHDLARHYGLDNVTTPIALKSRDWPATLAADATLQAIVHSRSQEPRTLLRQYLQQHGFFGIDKRVALIDIGWNGSIQRALKDAFGEDDNWPHVTGYYLSYNDNLGHQLDEHEAVGILFDKRKMHARYSSFEHFEEIFENGARALHPTTIGYRQKADNTIEPILLSEDASDRCAERSFDPMVRRLREGALAYAEHFREHYAFCSYSAADIRPHALQLAMRAVFFPRREEVDHLFSLVHTEDAGTESILDFSSYRLSGPGMLLRPFHLLRQLRVSNWKYGSGRSLGVPGFNHLLRLAHFLLIVRDQLHTRQRPKSRIPSSRWWERRLLHAVEQGGMPRLLRIRDKIKRLL